MVLLCVIWGFCCVWVWVWRSISCLMLVVGFRLVLVVVEVLILSLRWVIIVFCSLCLCLRWLISLFCWWGLRFCVMYDCLVLFSWWFFDVGWVMWVSVYIGWVLCCICMRVMVVFEKCFCWCGYLCCCRIFFMLLSWMFIGGYMCCKRIILI